MEDTRIDLLSTLTVDTFFRIKTSDGWYTIIVPIRRKNGTERLYGEIYNFYCKKENFRMAMGLVLNESDCGKYWVGKTQYLYFDKHTPPHFKEPPKVFKNPFLFPKRKWEL